MRYMKKASSSRKRSYHHGNLRKALLAASLKLVTRHGVEAFSLREAARAVGVSVAAAYRHFEDRSALLRALAHEGLAQLALEMEEAVSTAPGAPESAERSVAELSRIGAVYVEFAVAHPSRFRVMFGPWCDLADELTPELLPRGRDPLQVLVDTLDGMVRTGAITEAARKGAEISAWSTVHGFASLLVAGGVLGTGDVAQTYPAVLRTLLLGLGVSPGLAGPPSGTTLRVGPGTGSGVVASGRETPAHRGSPSTGT
jgi:AcrR family transcriptional regulator